MERVQKYMQSGTEALMNIAALILTVISVKLYMTFEVFCPCLPGFNMVYGIGFMFIPPSVFLFLGLTINRYCILATEEHVRPVGGRTKNPAIMKNMISSTVQRALLAPVMWIIMSLLDGKSIICAFSESVNPEKFAELSNKTETELELLLAKIPCKKHDEEINISIRKAVSRYLRCLSQALGWSIIFLLILLAAVARALKPLLSNSAVAMQNSYWTRYTDFEEKFFDKACYTHNYNFAYKAISRYFESLENENRQYIFAIPKKKHDGKQDEKDYLDWITCPEQLDQVLEAWYDYRPPLNLNQNMQLHCEGERVTLSWVPNENNDGCVCSFRENGTSQKTAFKEF
ncbi:calcium homeostasis modulator protein 3-like [Protopterus annectens]|uniref:calcium homeostasis modulator protein 3-like n=1 Tax=Protopterus annectens TaxID=7888 RepID=UPI001CF95BA7|nr:calcium homeostasis modulator protein 3-like [Protopterus annectens]